MRAEASLAGTLTDTRDVGQRRRLHPARSASVYGRRPLDVNSALTEVCREPPSSASFRILKCPVNVFGRSRINKYPDSKIKKEKQEDK